MTIFWIEWHINGLWFNTDLTRVGTATGHSGSMMAKGRQTSQDEVDGTDLKSHASQQKPIIRGEGSRAKQGPEHVEGQRG